MPFDNRTLKALPGFLCGALLILTSSLAHAERVLTETIFDDDGVRSFIYDRVESSEPEPSEQDAPELTLTSTLARLARTVQARTTRLYRT